MRFRLGRIPVVVRGSFFIVTLLLGYSTASTPSSIAIWFGVVFVSVLFHELGHALAFIRFGHNPSIELYQMGGLTRGTPGMPTSPGRHALISLAGPFAGFLLGGVTFSVKSVLGEVPPFAADVISDMLWVNFGWGIYNLLPIWPLDGGQALTGALRVVAPRQGERIGLLVSCAATAAVVAGALYTGWTWGAFIAAWFGISGFQRLMAIWSHRPTTPDDFTLEKIRNGDVDGARMMFEMHGDLNERTHEAVASAMFVSGRFEESRALSERSYRRFQSGLSALFVAACDAKLGRPESAVEWLQRAIAAGIDRNEIADNEDLASLRGRSDFEALLRG
jgi:Zn-dependent protease